MLQIFSFQSGITQVYNITHVQITWAAWLSTRWCFKTSPWWWVQFAHTHTSKSLPQSWSLCGSSVVGCVVVGKNGWGFMFCSGGHFIEEACGLSDFRPSKQALIHDVCNKFEGNKRNSFKDYCSLFNFWYVFHSRTNKSSIVTTVM